MLHLFKKANITDEATKCHLFLNAANDSIHSCLLQKKPTTFNAMVVIAQTEGHISQAMSDHHNPMPAQTVKGSMLMPLPAAITSAPPVSTAMKMPAAHSYLPPPVAPQAPASNVVDDIISTFGNLSINDANAVMGVLGACWARRNPVPMPFNSHPGPWPLLSVTNADSLDTLHVTV